MAKQNLANALGFAQVVKTKIGNIAIAWNDQNKIIALQLPEKSDALLKKKMAEKLEAYSIQWDSKDLPTPVKQIIFSIQEHFTGKPLYFPFDYLHTKGMSPFFQKVYRSAHKIPSGKVSTYKEIATKSGSPLASRAVGQAMARNPLPLLIPCHRVVGHNKKLVGFSASGGISTKEKLLEIESKLHANRS
jgi:methylated-DNA-[protein]-cysteine S-methyltransferase